MVQTLVIFEAGKSHGMTIKRYQHPECSPALRPLPGDPQAASVREMVSIVEGRGTCSCRHEDSLSIESLCRQRAWRSETRTLLGQTAEALIPSSTSTKGTIPRGASVTHLTRQARIRWDLIGKYQSLLEAGRQAGRQGG